MDVYETHDFLRAFTPIPPSHATIIDLLISNISIYLASTCQHMPIELNVPYPVLLAGSPLFHPKPYTRAAYMKFCSSIQNDVELLGHSCLLIEGHDVKSLPQLRYPAAECKRQKLPLKRCGGN